MILISYSHNCDCSSSFLCIYKYNNVNRFNDIFKVIIYFVLTTIICIKKSVISLSLLKILIGCDAIPPARFSNIITDCCKVDIILHWWNVISHVEIRKKICVDNINQTIFQVNHYYIKKCLHWMVSDYFYSVYWIFYTRFCFYDTFFMFTWWYILYFR